MHEVLYGKKVIFFDVGYTLDHPLSGDWILTNKFYELAGKHFNDALEKCGCSARDTVFILSELACSNSFERIASARNFSNKVLRNTFAEALIIMVCGSVDLSDPVAPAICA